MKKLISIALVLTLTLCTFSFCVSATSEDTFDREKVIRRTVEYFSDGTVMETVITEEASVNTARATQYTKSGTKSNTLKNADGDVLWSFTLRGQFDVVEGVSSVCTLAKHSYNIYDNSWSLDSASTSKSANKAIGNATFKKKVLFVTTDTKSFTLTLTCDKYGNLS